jgi:hypothetical protein
MFESEVTARCLVRRKKKREREKEKHRFNIQYFSNTSDHKTHLDDL